MRKSRMRALVAAGTAAVLTSTAIVVSSFTVASASDLFDLPAPELLSWDVGEGYRAAGRITLIPPLMRPDLVPTDPFDAEAQMWAQLDYERKLKEYDEWRAIEKSVRDVLKKQYPIDIEGPQGNEVHLGRKGDPMTLSWHEKDGSPVMQGPDGKDVSGTAADGTTYTGTQKGAESAYHATGRITFRNADIDFSTTFGAALVGQGSSASTGSVVINAYRAFGEKNGTMTFSGHVNITGADTYSVNVGKRTGVVSFEATGPNGEKVGGAVTFDANGDVMAISVTAEFSVGGKDIKVRVDISSQSVNWGVEPIKGFRIGGSSTGNQGSGGVNVDILQVFRALTGG